MLRTWAIAFLLLTSATAHAQAPDVGTIGDGAVVLVANPAFRHPLYGGSVLIAKPVGGGSLHFGFILNKKTKATLADLFPEHAASRQIAGPVYLGGPIDVNTVFALIEREKNADTNLLRFYDSIYLAANEKTIDAIIEKGAEDTKFLVGSVAWRHGELAEEIRRGMWHVMEVEKVLPISKDTQNLWERLLTEFERRKSQI